MFLRIYALILFLIIAISVKADDAFTTKVIYVDSDVLTIEGGMSQGLEVGQKGYVYYNITVNGKDTKIRIAEISLTEVRADISLARVIDKTKDMKPGFYVEIESTENQMVLIPAGEFQIGDSFNEGSVHTIYLDAFYIDKYEVTNAQYKKFMDATGYKAPLYWKDSDYNAPNQPVIGVNWYNAKAYADWAGKRLPTEAEWEKAARGGLVGKKYVWGNNWPPPKNSGNFADETVKKTFPDWSIVNGYDDGYAYTAPVGKFTPNSYGLYDMSGNVWEWCSDWYDANYYSSIPKSNPKGPDFGESKIVRGSNWFDSHEFYLRVATRNFRFDPTYRFIFIGFRCVQDIPK
jgi:formylglycine-generating enzyme